MAETTTRSITITNIDAKHSAKGKPFWKVATEGGDYMQIWKPDVYERVKDGGYHTVVVEANTAGDKTFYNIVGIGPDEPIDGSDFLGLPIAPRPTAATPKSISPPPVMNDTAARSTGLLVAGRLVAAGKAPENQMLELAGKLAAWITADDTAPKYEPQKDGRDPDDFLSGA